MERTIKKRKSGRSATSIWALSSLWWWQVEKEEKTFKQAPAVYRIQGKGTVVWRRKHGILDWKKPAMSIPKAKGHL